MRSERGDWPEAIGIRVASLASLDRLRCLDELSDGHRRCDGGCEGCRWCNFLDFFWELLGFLWGVLACRRLAHAHAHARALFVCRSWELGMGAKLVVVGTLAPNFIFEVAEDSQPARMG